MKTKRNHLKILFSGVIALIMMYGCKTGTPGDAVRTAMEEELIKEKAEKYIEENKVPAVVVDEFVKNHSDSIERQWLVYEQEPGKEVSVDLPEVYIVAFRKADQNYRTKYSREGEVIDRTRLSDLSVLPDKALDILQKGDYKDWKIVGDIFETLDKMTMEPTGFIVRVEKSDQTKRLFFDLQGNIVKIQKISG
jgi:hypothetical protein